MNGAGQGLRGVTGKRWGGGCSRPSVSPRAVEEPAETRGQWHPVTLTGQDPKRQIAIQASREAHVQLKGGRRWGALSTS